MNHKTNLLSLLLIGSIFMPAFGSEKDEVLKLQHLVDAATAQARHAGCLDAEMIVDNFVELNKTYEFRILQDSLVESWQAAVSNLDNIARDDMSKTITLCSCWNLHEANYISFLNECARLVEEKRLNPTIFRWSQSPFESPLTGFLVRNYKNPDVQNIIIRSIKIFKDQPEFVADYNKMLTGESRQKLAGFEKAMREENITNGEVTSKTSPTKDFAGSDGANPEAKSEQKNNNSFIMITVLCLFFFTTLCVLLRLRKKD